MKKYPNSTNTSHKYDKKIVEYRMFTSFWYYPTVRPWPS